MDLSFLMPGEEECITTLRDLRWNDGVVRCVSCGSHNVNRDGVKGMYRRYWCKRCDSYFNDRSGTIFEDTKVPLRKWFMITFLLQFKLPILEISEAAGVSYRNAYYIAKKLRGSVFAKQIAERINEKLETDEGYTYGRMKKRLPERARKSVGKEEDSMRTREIVR